jgi:PKD repeat protein
LQTLTGKTATYTFNTPGIYTVTLTLLDSYGNSTSTVTITVQSNSKPIAKITVEGLAQGQNAVAGQPITLDGSGSYEPNNGTIVKYIWETSSGDPTALNDTSSFTQIGSNVTITHTFAAAAAVKGAAEAEYNVTLTVFDATNLNATASTIITVGQGTNTIPSPSATTTPNPGSSPSPASTSTSSTSTPATTSGDTIQSSGVPSDILVILIIITIAVLAGSTVWLRKRT